MGIAKFVDQRLIRYVLVILLGLAGLVWLADQFFLHNQQQSLKPEVQTLVAWLEVACPNSSQCEPMVKALPGLQLQPINALYLPENLNQDLANGKTIYAQKGEEQYYYYRHLGDQLVKLGPFDSRSEHNDGWYSQVFYLLLGLAILLSLYPFIKDMQNLKVAATQFARNRNPQVFQFRHSNFFAPVLSAIAWMSQELARTLALQQELSATLSHELRTPISRLKFALASVRAPKSLQQEMQSDLEELEMLVDEYLTFAKLQYDKPLLDFEPTQIADLITPLIAQLGQYTHKKIAFNTDHLSRPVWVDRRSLSRALKNILDNAIKYAHSRIRVELVITSEAVAIIVEDDGPGLQGQNMENIFLPYVREDQVAKISGYGLGLAIVRKIMAWHQGQILAGPSTALGGARFVLSLPTAPHENVAP